MFEPMFNCTFSIHVLKVSNMSYALACYTAQLNFDYVISYVNNDIVYKTKGYGTSVIGPRTLLNL